MLQLIYIPLLIIPVLTIFGNVLVILAVLRETALKTSTNLLLVSLAAADLIVAVVVMPFAVYTLVNNQFWELPSATCYVFLIGDVSASTASIIHMVAISADRFYAVFYHVYYKTERHRQFVVVVLVLCWFFSASLTLPAAVGFRFSNSTCFIDSPEFMLYGSIFAFYIPCIIMFITYGFVFYKLNRRFKTVRQISLAAEPDPDLNGAGPSQYLETMLMNAHGGNSTFRRNTISWAMPFVLQGLDPEEFMDETDSVSSGDLAELTTIIFQMESTTTNEDTSASAGRSPCRGRSQGRLLSRLRAKSMCSPLYNFPASFIRRRQMSVLAATEQLKKLKFRAVDMFTKLRTKQGKAIRKETKATKLVTTVLVVFLICWMPFFTLNTTRAVYLKLGSTHEWPEYADVLFIVFTWLGYFNSCINPFIYSVLNTRFRDAFSRLLGCQGNRAEREQRRRHKSMCLRELHMRSLEMYHIGRTAGNSPDLSPGDQKERFRQTDDFL